MTFLERLRSGHSGVSQHTNNKFMTLMIVIIPIVLSLLPLWCQTLGHTVLHQQYFQTTGFAPDSPIFSILLFLILTMHVVSSRKRGRIIVARTVSNPSIRSRLDAIVLFPRIPRYVRQTISMYPTDNPPGHPRQILHVSGTRPYSVFVGMGGGKHPQNRGFCQFSRLCICFRLANIQNLSFSPLKSLFLPVLFLKILTLVIHYILHGEHLCSNLQT